MKKVICKVIKGYVLFDIAILALTGVGEILNEYCNVYSGNYLSDLNMAWDNTFDNMRNKFKRYYNLS